MRVPFQWNTANFAWDANPFSNQSVTPFTWDDVALITELAQALGGGHRDPSHYQQILKDPDKKQRYIKLLCKVKGKKYKKTKRIKDFKIVISDVELVVQEFSSIIKIQL